MSQIVGTLTGTVAAGGSGSGHARGPGAGGGPTGTRTSEAQTLSPVVTARLAGALLVGAGLTGVPLAVLPSTVRGNLVGLTALSIATLAVGAVTLVLPWGRWPARAQLWGLALPVSGLLFGRGVIFGPHDETRALFYVVVGAWIGISQGQFVSLQAVPLLTAAYLAPLAVAHDPVTPHVGPLVQTLLVYGCVAESLAWVAQRLRRAEHVGAQRLQGMDSLLRAATALAYELEPAGATATIAGLGRDLLGAAEAVVYLVTDDGQLVRERRTGGAAGAERAARAQRAAAASLAQATVSSGSAAPGATDGGDGPPAGVTDDADAVPAEAQRAIADVQVVAAPGPAGLSLFLPLLGTTGPLAALELRRCGTDEADTFTRHLARTFMIQAGLALERAWSRERLVDTSMRDELTGLNNRRWAMAALAQVVPGDAIVMIDLDHFKGVNDSMGHAAGDDLLQQFARFLDDAVRAGDELARFGGEEFILVLRHCDGSPFDTVERLRTRWEARLPMATFSAGIACHVAGVPVSDTLALADAALYEAKRAGRNRVRQARARRTRAVPARRSPEPPQHVPPGAAALAP